MSTSLAHQPLLTKTRSVTFEAEPTWTLIDQLLHEQRELTAVERFSQRHGSATAPLLESHYRDLIPLTKPGANEQYAFEVNLDKCTGCKACVSACHSLNGLDETETWRDVGLIRGGTETNAYQQTITSACHHCADPACANGCPVLAYEKDDATGIVRHLDDQCIGCQYCSLKCPYDVPKYSKTLGIVRKCDMCHSRLAAGEAPACVQACPTEAIRIVTVERNAPVAVGESLVPGTISSTYTKPTTKYFSRRPIPANARFADIDRPRREHSHLPLVFMLTLTQIATGLLVAGAVAPRLQYVWNGLSLSPLHLAAFLVFSSGLVISVFHLGQPFKAWRVFLGLRRSWLSREIVVCGSVPALCAAAALVPSWFAWPAAIAGICGVFTSVMVYADTHRKLWVFRRSFFRFYSTVLIFALAALTTFLGRPDYAILAVCAVALKLLIEARFLRHSTDDAANHDALSARLLITDFRGHLIARFSLALAGCLLLIGTTGSGPLALFAMAILSASELMERLLFFKTVVAYRMPGP